MASSDPNEPAPAGAIPAATLVIFRGDGRGGLPRILMVERAATLAFAGGAMVFPGGRIDPGDHDLAAALPDRSAVGAARVAAVRETVEEAGLAVALDPAPDARALTMMRRGLHAGRPFADLLRQANVRLVPDRLVPFARWRPAHRDMRIFDTWFFLAEAPPGAEATADGTENTRLTWTTAADALAEAEAGRVKLIFPTRRNLERLARFASFADAVADAGAHPIRTVTPWVEERGGVPHLCIPDDLGYPVTAEPLSAATRA